MSLHSKGVGLSGGSLAQETLKAGGMVPANAKLGKNDAVDVVVARAYRHAVLPGRTVIRLTAESVATGDDLEMATLGFGAGESRGAVAKERKRPLGFPGWALVNDPKNARYALDVVKEFKKQARKAKSKPGHAKDAIDAIAAKLGKTVPHFLPSFYEEAGRAFIEHGAASFAAAMFGKAREAEQVHALDVDEQHRIDGFLEFALAGAVTTKSLSAYAKELADHHSPVDAYAHFRQLCLQRTLGGMPPWSGMAKELGKLAKAAKLDPDREDAAFVAEIIESPALAKAAGEFWRAYAAPIAELGKQNPSARGALLNLFPTGSTYNADLDDAWLDLLDASGAIEALVADGQPAPSGSRAAWFDKLTSHMARSWRESSIGPRAFALLRRMAPKLIADGTPILCRGRYNQLDLDLLELALELGVPVAVGEHYPHLRLETWAKQATLPERGRDPVHAARHPQFGQILSNFVAVAIGDEPFDTVARGKQGFLAAKRAWLEKMLDLAERGGLPDVEHAIDQISKKAKPELFAEAPDLHARFAALDVVPAFARTLRIGVFDELGWPVFEEAARELNPGGGTELKLHGGPAAVIVASPTRAIVIGPTARLATHDFVIPPKHALVTMRYIGGELLVVLKESSKLRCYWSSSPRDVWEPGGNSWSVPPLVGCAVVFPDGAWLEGEKPMRVGDRTFSTGASISAYDGTTVWVREWKANDYHWTELSATGEKGRTSWPAWIEGAAEGEWRIDAMNSSLFRAPPGVTTSPLAIVDGLVGIRARYRGTGPHDHVARREIESIDGARFAAPAGVTACGLLRMPASTTRLPIDYGSTHTSGTAISIYDPSGSLKMSRLHSKDPRYLRGQPALLPYMFWHVFVARDEAGSRRLRAITDDDARALIAAVPAKRDPEPVDLPGVLPEVTHAKLRHGITGIAVVAVEQQELHRTLVAERAPGAARAGTSSGPDDAALSEMLGGWIDRRWNPSGSGWAQIERAADLFASDDRGDRTISALPEADVDWFDFALVPAALGFLALAIGTPKRELAIDLMTQLAKLPSPDKLRVYTQIHLAPTDADKTDYSVRWVGGNAYAHRRVGYGGARTRVLEYAPSGKFQALPNVNVLDEVSGDGAALSADERAAFAVAVSEGTTSWSEIAAARLATLTGLTPSEAKYLWAGCPSAHVRGVNFLAKELRETLGLKASQAAVARDGLNTIPIRKRRLAIAEAARAGVAALLDGSAVDAFADRWTRIVGKRVAVPEELIEEASGIDAGMEPSEALAMIAGGKDSPELVTDGLFGFDGRGDLIRVGKPEPLVGQVKTSDDSPVFDADVLHAAITYIPFIYELLPVGHTLRSQAAIAYDLVMSRLRNPALWITGGWVQNNDTKAFERMLAALGGEPVGGFESKSGKRFTGALLVVSKIHGELTLNPATLDAKARGLVDQIGGSQRDMSWVDMLDYARSDDLLAIVARITKSPVPEGGWEQNPLASVPKLVDKVVKQTKVSREAAALYLQFLVQLWPTSKNVQLWNGWTAKQVAAAAAELVEAELLLEAKRERAQRAHFLPGGWEALKTPYPPVESWKLPFYGARTKEGVKPRLAVLQRFQVLAPFHQLYERAWKRIEEGDVPRYEEVKR